MPVSEPVKPVLGVIVHALVTIVPSLSVDAQAMITGAPVKTAVGAVMAATGATFGEVTVIVPLAELVAPLLSVTLKVKVKVPAAVSDVVPPVRASKPDESGAGGEALTPQLDINPSGSCEETTTLKSCPTITVAGMFTVITGGVLFAPPVIVIHKESQSESP